MDQRAPLKAYLRQQRVVDAQLRRVLIAAARDARRKINLLGEGRANDIRRAQLELQEHQLRMWANIGTVIEDGIKSNAEAVAKVNHQFTRDVLKGIGLKPSDALARSLLATAQSTINNYLAREQLGITLSERIYRNGALASGKIDTIINNGLLRGASARELARDVGRYINPNAPGGTSYNAMRLARTELNNSFHQAAINTSKANPFVEKVQWELSSSHPRPDQCDEYVGTYAPDDVPEKPHPQCFCYITDVVISRAELVSRFKSGEFDEWADGQLSA